MTFALLTPAAAAQGGSEEQSTVSDIRKGLVSWSKAFGGIGQLPELETPLPLTDTSIGEILQIETAVALALERGLTDNQELSLAALEQALTDSGFLDVVVPSSLPDGPLAFSFSISLEVQDVPVALRYNDDVLRLRGGHITDGIDASVEAGPFRFVYDADESVDQLRFVQLTDEPAPDCVPVDPGDTCPPVPTIVTIHAENAAGTVTNASGVDGFVDVDLSGTYALDWDVTARMRDPNGRDRLAEEDLLYNSPGDLFFVNRGAGDWPVAVDLSLAIDVREDLPLTDGSLGIAGAGTIVLNEPDNDNVYGKVTVEAARDLALLRTITPSEGVLALVTGSAALTTAEAGIDNDLPLLDGSISNLYSPASEVRQLVEEMGGARFTCGATDTSPPIGLPDLGEPWFCQAEATGADPDVAITNVQWSVDNGTKDEASETDATVGTLDTPPTANLRIDDVTAQPRLTLRYSQVRTYESDEALTETVNFIARSGIESAQHLAGILAQHDFDQGALYDPDAEVLLFDLGHEVLGVDPVLMEPGGAASVGPVLGLRALAGVDDGTTVPVLVGERSQTVSLGVPLGENEDGPFLVVPGKQQMKIASIAADLDGSLAMEGRVGFLGVDVNVDALSFVSTGDAVTITYPGAIAHIFGSPDCGSACPDPVEDVVLLKDVLLDASSLGSTVTAQAASAEPIGQVNVTAAASMTVAAAPMPGGEDLLPSVVAEPQIEWASLAPDALPAVTEGLGALGLFDLIPDITGRITAADDSTSVVEDSQADFFVDFGVDATTPEDERFIDRTILNLTGGTSCTGFTVTSGAELTCLDELSGDSAVDDLLFETGDQYLVVGDEYALRDRLVDGQVAALNVLDNLDTIDATARIPGLDLRPADLARERDDLANLFEGLRGPEAAATMQDFVTNLGDHLEKVAIADDRLDVTVSSRFTDEKPATLLLQQGDLAFGTTGILPEPIVTLAASSTTTIGIGVDLSDGSTTALQGTGTVSHLDEGVGSEDQLANALALYGAVDTTVLGGSVGFDGLEVTLESGSDVPLPELRAVLESITEGASRSGAANTCSVDLDPEDEEPAWNLEGEICVLIAVKPTGAAATDAPTIVEYTANASDLQADQNDDEPADLSNEPLRLKFAGEALGYLATGLDEALDGDSNGSRMPLVGGVLDGGAGLTGDNDTLVIGTFRTQLRTALSGVDTSDTRTLDVIKSDIADRVNSKHADFGATVEFWCDEARTDDCATATSFDDVWDIQVAGTFSGSGDGTVPFASGLPGLPLHSTDKVSVTELSWSVPVAFGIARHTGPYLEFEAKTATIEFEANLPTDTCGAPNGYGKTYGTLDATRPTSDDAPCIDATMGVFPATLRDIGDGSSLDAKTTVALPDGRHSYGKLATDGLAVAPSLEGIGTIEAQFETWAQDAGMFDVAGIIELTWNTSRSDETVDGRPFIEVTYSYLRLDKGTFEQMLEPVLGDIDSWLGPIRPVLDEVRRPLPVVSDLSKMVGGDPVTLLSLLVAKGAKTDLIEAVAAFVDFISGTADPSDRGEELLQLGEIEEDPDDDGTTINFGWSTAKNKREEAIKELQKELDEESCTKAGARKNCWVPPSDKKTADPDKPKKSKNAMKGDLSLKIGISVPSITTPILDDSRQIYDLLLGKADAVLIRADFGELSASIGYTATIGPIILGPVPLEVSFGGSITATGRLSLGYDTYAISQAAATAGADYPGDPEELLAELKSWDSAAIGGFFIDDLDATGKDVPEISLTTVIKAGAGVTLVIIKAGIEGGVAMVIEFDVSDVADADHDGKIRIEEISSASCLFDISSYLYFFLQFYLRFDLPWPLPDFGWKFGTKSPKIPLFADTCQPVEPPALATVLPADDRSQDDLRINVVGAGEERYLARQMQTHELELISVGESGDPPVAYAEIALDSAPAVSVDEGEIGPADYRIVDVNDACATVAYGTKSGSFELCIDDPAIERTRMAVSGGGRELIYDMGAHGNVLGTAAGDPVEIRLEPGQEFAEDTEETVLATHNFTLDAVLIGGTKADTLIAADGDDLVIGCGDADRIELGFGDDRGYGDSGDGKCTGAQGADTIEGDQGYDRLFGGPGADTLQGGPGVDLLYGQDGGDQLDGGPGADPEQLMPVVVDDPADLPSGPNDPIPAVAEPQILAILDGGDLLVGGADIDALDGGFGTDSLYGGDLPIVGTGENHPYDPSAVQAEGFVPPHGTTELTVSAIFYPPDLGQVEPPLPVIRDDVTVNLLSITWPTGTEWASWCRSGDLTTSETGLPDLVNGGPDTDYLLGSDGNDRLEGGGGADYLCGRNGDDLIIGDGPEAKSDDRASLHGDDIVRGGLGRDRIFGDGGNDTVFGDQHVDMIRGGDGADEIFGGSDSDLILGGSGADVVFGEGGDMLPLDGTAYDPDLIDDTGDDQVEACSLSVLILRGKFDVNADFSTVDQGDVGFVGDDGFVDGYRVLDGLLYDQSGVYLYSGQLGDFVVKDGRVDLDSDGVYTAADTVLVNLPTMSSASHDGDCIFGGSGDDIITGGAGGDHLEGGADADTLTGDTGKDFIRGNAEDDVLNGGTDNDFLVGDAGRDSLTGEQGADRLWGGEGSDRLIGGSQNGGVEDGPDALFGGGGADVLAGDNAQIRDRRMGDPESAVFLPGETIDTHVKLYDLNDGGGFHGSDELFGGFGNDYLFGQDGDDLVRGGHDDDYVEGNAGDDRVQGDDHNDVVLGGGSATDGVFSTDRSAEGLTAGDDTVFGDRGADGLDGHDMLLGDNGVVTFVGVKDTGDGTQIPMFDVGLPGESTSGSDVLVGGGGWDVLIGQLGDVTRTVPAVEACLDEQIMVRGDLLCGGSENDVLIGDLGTVTWTTATDLGTTQDLSINGVKNTVIPVFQPNTIIPVVELLGGTSGGPDILMGGDGTDWLHGGPGDDLANGGPGDDVLFGADGDDALWGGLGNDRLYGGHGTTGKTDSLDVKPRTGIDPADWFIVAPDVDRNGNTSPTNGIDLMYGGWGHDALQADHAVKGAAGDRLIDWAGQYNVYYVCDSSNGRDTIIRSPSTGMEEFLRLLAINDGAASDGSGTLTASGAGELAYVFPQDIKSNTSPKHPDVRGPFSCAD